jgi:hypothetical protein
MDDFGLLRVGVEDNEGSTKHGGRQIPWEAIQATKFQAKKN